jgi:hypothetical protein
MKKQGWKIVLASTFLALAGYGGGSSSSDTNVVQIPSAISRLSCDLLTWVTTMLVP